MAAAVSVSESYFEAYKDIEPGERRNLLHALTGSSNAQRLRRPQGALFDEEVDHSLR